MLSRQQDAKGKDGRLRLILFDVDGTLVDSQNIICAAMERAFGECRLPPPSRARTLSIVGLSLPEAMARLAEGEGGEMQARLVEAYRGAFFTLRQDPAHVEPLFPGAAETIETLAREPELVLGIVTGKARRGLDAVMKRTGLAGHFMTTQSADDAPSKPHPAMVLQAMAETGVVAGETVVIGDTTFDMAMARAAGAVGIGVSWGYHPADELLTAGAGRIIDSFAELPAALDHAGLLGSGAAHV